MERKKYILGRIGLYFLAIWGEAELILRIWGAKEKYFQGAVEFSFRVLGVISALFSGIEGAQTPLGASLCDNRSWTSF